MITEPPLLSFIYLIYFYRKESIMFFNPWAIIQIVFTFATFSFLVAMVYVTLQTCRIAALAAFGHDTIFVRF